MLRKLPIRFFPLTGENVKHHKDFANCKRRYGRAAVLSAWSDRRDRGVERVKKHHKSCRKLTRWWSLASIAWIAFILWRAESYYPSVPLDIDGNNPAVLAAFASVVLLLFRASTPHVAFLGRAPGTNLYSDIARHPENEGRENQSPRATPRDMQSLGRTGRRAIPILLPCR